MRRRFGANSVRAELLSASTIHFSCGPERFCHRRVAAARSEARAHGGRSSSRDRRG